MKWRGSRVLVAALCFSAWCALDGGTLARPVEAQAQTHPEADRLAVALRDALASGEFKRVRWVVPQTGPLLTWLSERWHELRSGAWEARSWQVRYEPYYVHTDAMAGVLRVTAQSSSGASREETFQIEAVRRGGVWVFADPIPLERPDARVVRQEINLDLRLPGRLRAEALFRWKAEGPDRRLFFELAPGLQVAGAAVGATPVPFQQRGNMLYVLASSGDPNAVLKLNWEGPAEGVWGALTPGRMSVLEGSRAWWPRQPIPGRAVETKVAVMLPAGWVSLMPGEPAELERFPDGWLYRHQSDGSVADLPLWVGDWNHREERPGVTPVTGFAQPAQAGFLAAAAGEIQGISGYLAERLGLPTPRHWLLGEAGVAPSKVQGNVVLLSSETLASDVMRRTFLPGAMARALLERGNFAGTFAEQALMREGVPGYLAVQLLADTEGPAAARSRLWESIRRYESLVGTPQDQPLRTLSADLPDEARRTLLEDKAVVVLHMLRNRVGEKAFNRAVQRWASQGERTWQGFVAACEAEGKVALGPFVAQWVERPGRPEVALSEVSVETAAQGFAVVGKITQVGEPFALRLPLVLNTTGKARIYHLELGPGEVDFKLLSPDRPVRLRVDPAHDWLLKGPGPLELGN